MQYGQTNNLLQRCTLCGQSLDKHRIKIVSDERTDRLARQVQAALDKVAVHARSKGFAQAKGDATMVGAAIATIKNREYRFATVSGRDVEVLRHMDKHSVGADVELVKEVSYDRNEPARSYIGKLATIAGLPYVVTVAISDMGGNVFPPGACCAPKLLMAIFRKHAAIGGEISQIRMSEMFWKNTANGTQGKSNWSSGEAVHSCDTCKRVVPVMLCDIAE